MSRVGLVLVICMFLISCGNKNDLGTRSGTKSGEINGQRDTVYLRDTIYVQDTVVYEMGILPKPSGAFFETFKNDHDIEIRYLEQYFGILTDREVLKSYEGTKDPCSFKQRFKKGIVFEREECEEVGANVKILFPGYEKSELLKYINWFFGDQENVWNKEKTEFSPKDGGAGCYLEVVKRKNGDWAIEYYCGC